MKSNMTLWLRIIERFGTQEKLSIVAGIPGAIVSKIVLGLKKLKGA